MLGITDLWLFVAAGLLLNITPGPDMAYIMGRSAQLGARAGAVAALGITAGCFVHIAAAALGLSAILSTSAEAFFILKLVGAVYLVWVGISLLRNAGVSDAAASNGRAAISLRGIFLQGFLTNALNPKVALFFLAFLPQFISAGAPSKALAFVVLGLIFCATGTIVCLMVAWFTARASAALSAGSVVRTWMERALGSLFVLLGIRLAFLQRSL
ncbi:LysE family translocator [Hyphomicrobium sp. CS1BSMeth3]|uniref:LysE family translocator n=1 Tax=Hyphomicrobium sp. CS1BSMeth3 TaxID=1892844 RepID=UPI0009318E22|nr:LysE family translocator [Hyphomicrobium sp. CS1BSMeth3]